MTLAEVRKLFVKQSGRYDLVTVSGATFDNNPEGFGGGVDFYIQEGQKFLERRLNFPKDEGELTVSLATSAFTTTLEGVRAVRAVGVVDEEDSTIRYIERSSMKEIREAYGDENSSLANVEAGEPTVWTLGFRRTGLTGTTSADGDKVLLVTMPPADRDYSLIVECLLGNSALTGDASVSFWTIQQPQVLIWAALYLMEVSYRNSQGAAAFLGSIDDALLGIDNDVVEQEIVETSRPKSIFRFIKEPSRRAGRHL